MRSGPLEEVESFIARHLAAKLCPTGAPIVVLFDDRFYRYLKSLLPFEKLIFVASTTSGRTNDHVHHGGSGWGKRLHEAIGTPSMILWSAVHIDDSAVSQTLQEIRSALGSSSKLLCGFFETAGWSPVLSKLSNPDRGFRLLEFELFKRQLATEWFRILEEEVQNVRLPSGDVATICSVAASPILSTAVTSDLAPRPSAQNGVSIVVLTYNSRRTIIACLHSIISCMRQEDELIVVDNGSSDGTQEYLRDRIQGSKSWLLICNTTNLGFSCGCNKGIRESTRSYVLLVNPDVILSANAIEKLTMHLKDERVAAVGPVTDNVCGSQFAGLYIPKCDDPSRYRQELATRFAQEYSGISLPTKLLIGFCFMTRRKVFEEFGLLDERIFLGGEDLEFSLRLRANGRTLSVALDTFVAHEMGVSFSSKTSEERKAILSESTDSLRSIIRGMFGWLPSDVDLWGVPFIE